MEDYLCVYIKKSARIQIFNVYEIEQCLYICLYICGIRLYILI